MKAFLAALFLTLALLSAPSTSTAQGAGVHTEIGNATLYPTVLYPLHKRYGAGAIDINVMGNYNAYGWNAKHRFNIIDGKFHRLHVTYNRTCRYYQWCLYVHSGNYGRTGWWGLTNYGATAKSTDMYLNTYYGRNQWVPTHEFLHTLGMPHYSRGTVGLMHLPTPSLRYMSHAEYRALARYYR